VTNDNHDDIFSFIDKYGVVNKDMHSQGKKQTKQRKTITARKKSFRETLDLHGLTSSEASVRLRFAVDRCQGRGIKELLVIHGVGYHSTVSGGPVLKQMVVQMLENELCLHVRDYRRALPKDGGDGATLVYLR